MMTSGELLAGLGRHSPLLDDTLLPLIIADDAASLCRYITCDGEWDSQLLPTDSTLFSSVFCLALDLSSMRVVDFLLKVGLHKLTSRCLLHSVRHGRLGLTRTLLSQGLVVDGCVDQQCKSVVHHALVCGDAEMLKDLLSHTQSRDSRLSLLTQTDCCGNTPLHVASNLGHAGMLATLLHACSSSDVDKGAVLSVVNVVNVETGRSPLHDACVAGHRHAAQMLIEWGADCNLVDYRGQTPLQNLFQLGLAEFIDEQLFTENNNLSGDTRVLGKVVEYLYITLDLIQAGAHIDIRKRASSPASTFQQLWRADGIQFVLEDVRRLDGRAALPIQLINSYCMAPLPLQCLAAQAAAADGRHLEYVDRGGALPQILVNLVSSHSDKGTCCSR